MSLESCVGVLIFDPSRFAVMVLRLRVSAQSAEPGLADQALRFAPFWGALIYFISEKYLIIFSSFDEMILIYSFWSSQCADRMLGNGFVLINSLRKCSFGPCLVQDSRLYCLSRANVSLS